jgi:uncharacterized protein YgiM (DUF1202 family)
MAGKTEESARFKKVEQTVGGGDNNKLVGNTNDEIFKQVKDTDATGAPTNTHDTTTESAIEQDLETKVRDSMGKV